MITLARRLSGSSPCYPVFTSPISRSAIHAVASHYGVVKDPGFTLRVTDQGWIVSAVNTSGGAAAGRVEIGDRLLAFKGDERAVVIGTSQFRNVAGQAKLPDRLRASRTAGFVPVTSAAQHGAGFSTRFF